MTILVFYNFLAKKQENWYLGTDARPHAQNAETRERLTIY